jgi:hypothetical protein
VQIEILKGFVPLVLHFGERNVTSFYRNDIIIFAANAFVVYFNKATFLLADTF